MTLVLLLLLGQVEPLEQTLKKVVARHELRDVVSRSAELSQHGAKPVVVFDVDDTLFGAHDGSLYTADNLQVKAIKGASAYLHALANAGAKIVYLTGRGESWRKTTEAQFAKFDFPLGGPHELVLNPAKDWQGHEAAVEFKKSMRPQILAMGRPLAFFDNDKGNVRLFREQYPSSKIFRLRTLAGRPDPGGSGKILVINDYRPALGKAARPSTGPAATWPRIRGSGPAGGPSGARRTRLR